MTHEISVITPIYNRPDLIPALFDTLRGQSFADWELVLVDDASREDPSPAFEAAQTALPGGPDARMRLIRLEQNAGPAGARNAGMDAAQGRFFAFLDSDDRWEPEKLAAQHAALMSLPDPDRAFCVCRTAVKYPGGQVIARPSRGLNPDESGATFLYVANEFAQCSAFFSGAALARDVRFDERLRQYEDHLFFMALAKAASDTALVPDTLSHWNNDARADRMGASDDVGRGEKFIAIAKAEGLMTDAEALAFRLRCLGPVMMDADRLAGLQLALKGIRNPDLPREASAKLLLAGLIGPKLYQRLREARR